MRRQWHGEFDCMSVAAILQGGNLSELLPQLPDPTFRGLYQANGFDLAIMLPYFLVMVVLAAYGIHRYVLVYNFFTSQERPAGPPVTSSGRASPSSFPSTTSAM